MRAEIQRQILTNHRKALFLSTLATLMEESINGKNEGHVFQPFESDDYDILFVGDTVFTKYGDEGIVTEIASNGSFTLADKQTFDFSRISYVTNRIWWEEQ